MDVRDLPPVSDDEIVGMWRIAADDAASHKASVCGEGDGTVNNHAALGRMFGISKQHARAICLGRKRAL